MHVFEKTVQLAQHSTQGSYYPPLQLLLGIKARNGGKLNSHLWFFSAFCRQLKPEFIMVSAGDWFSAYSHSCLTLVHDQDTALWQNWLKL